MIKIPGILGFLAATLVFSSAAHANEDAVKAAEAIKVAPTAQTADAGTTKKEEPVAGGPNAELKQRMEELFATSKKVNAPGGEGEKARMQIRGSMDWDRIAVEAIGKGNWKKQTAKRQTEFKTLLRDVVEKTAYSRLDKFWTNGTTYRFEKIELKGGDAHVPARFVVNGKGFVIDYYLNEKANRWLIHDIAYEGLRYSENIHEQIDAFLKEKSFAELLGKLRKRREELTSEEAKPKSS